MAACVLCKKGVMDLQPTIIIKFPEKTAFPRTEYVCVMEVSVLRDCVYCRKREKEIIGVFTGENVKMRNKRKLKGTVGRVKAAEMEDLRGNWDKGEDCLST